jgi:hypothetical protein
MEANEINGEKCFSSLIQLPEKNLLIELFTIYFISIKKNYNL